MEVLQERGIERHLSLLLLSVGGALRLWQYLGHSSLWLDEISLARNFAERSLIPLLAEPLAYHQVAPPGFLWLEKMAADSLGTGELALRLFPFVAGLAALPLFWAVSARVQDGPSRLMARALFAFGFPFIWHASEVKQYSTDITIGLAITLLALKLAEGPVRGSLAGWAVIGGTVAMWFSTPAVLMLAGVSGALLIETVLSRGELAALTRVLLGWGLGALAATLWAYHTLSLDTSQFMKGYWQGSFLPLPPHTLLEAVWPIERLGSLFGQSGLRYAWPALQLPLAVLGFWTLFRARRGSSLILLGPIVVTFLAAVVHRYPFSGRLVAFLLPAVVLGLAQGIERLSGLLRARFGTPLFALRGILLAPALGPVLLAPPVYRQEDAAPILAYLGRHRQLPDRIFLFHGAGAAVDYYGPRYGLSGDFLIGGCHRENPRRYLEELDRLRGAPRAWLILVHYPETERLEILAYLNRIGVPRDSLTVPANLPLAEPQGAWLYLFDLSDPARLASTTAAAMPLAYPPSGECRPPSR